MANTFWHWIHISALLKIEGRDQNLVWSPDDPAIVITVTTVDSRWLRLCDGSHSWVWTKDRHDNERSCADSTSRWSRGWQPATHRNISRTFYQRLSKARGVRNFSSCVSKCYTYFKCHAWAYMLSTVLNVVAVLLNVLNGYNVGNDCNVLQLVLHVSAYLYMTL